MVLDKTNECTFMVTDYGGKHKQRRAARMAIRLPGDRKRGIPTYAAGLFALCDKTGNKGQDEKGASC